MTGLVAPRTCLDVGGHEPSVPYGRRRGRQGMRDSFLLHDVQPNAIEGGQVPTTEAVRLARPTKSPGHSVARLVVRGSSSRARHGKARIIRSLALSPGTRLGPCQIGAALGAGGMAKCTGRVRSRRYAAEPLIRAAASRALEIEPSASGPHFLLGTLASVHDYDWKVAGDEFSKAMSASAASACRTERRRRSTGRAARRRNDNVERIQ